ncbi:hypothetical protein QTP86_016237 [Hemibagrus guttatus]|nr:hypothetical protein QTP86_016237 [Hemibagrus guttatus]
METPDTTPVQGDGGDVDMADEPVFKVPNKRKKQGTLSTSQETLLESLKALEIEIVELQRLEATGDRGHIEALKSKKAKMNDLLDITEQGALVRSRFKSAAEMDAPSKFFFSLEQKNGQKRFIHAVRTESGDLLSESTEIRKQTVSFYSKLYSSEWSGAEVVEDSFLVGLPKLSERAARELDRELSLRSFMRLSREWRMDGRGERWLSTNLAASSLWHKLACVDPPPNLLANIQAQLVDFFWDGLHWIPQSVLHLPKEEGGQGLVQLSSRSRSLPTPVHPETPHWTQRPSMESSSQWILHTVKGLGLDRALFLMDTKMLDISGLPMFYRELFRSGMFLKNKTRAVDQYTGCWRSLWYTAGDWDISGVTVPALSRTLVSSGIVTLRELVNVARSDLSRAEDLAARM